MTDSIPCDIPVTFPTDPARVMRGGGGRFNVTAIQELADLTIPHIPGTTAADGTRRPGRCPRFRVTNIVGVRVFAIDWDLLDGHDLADDLKALHELCDRLQLPHPSFVIATGTGGCHLHWHLTETIAVKGNMGPGVKAWRRFNVLILDGMGITAEPELKAKLVECKPTTLWPGPGQPSRKPPHPEAKLIGGTGMAVDMRDVFERCLDLLEQAPALAELAKDPSGDYRLGRTANKPSAPFPDGPSEGYRDDTLTALKALPPKSTDDGRHELFMVLHLAAIDCDRYFKDNTVQTAVIEADGRPDAASRLDAGEARKTTYRSLRFRLTEEGVWPARTATRKAKRVIPHSTAEGSSTGQERAAEDESNQYSPRGRRVSLMDEYTVGGGAGVPDPDATGDDGEMGEQFPSAEALIEKHYPCRLNQLTRDLEQDGNALDIEGLYLEAEAKGLTRWTGRWRRVKPDPQSPAELKRVYSTLTKTEFGDAITAYGTKHSFSPHMEWAIRILGDDTIKPIDPTNLATRYLKAPNTGEHKIANLLVGKTIMGILRRIQEPGTQVDLMMVLLGDQGTGKSRFCRVLGGDGYLDGVTLDDPGRDQVMKYSSFTVGEVSEFSTAKRDQDRLKALITTTADSYRLPYARRTQTFPRVITFVGTSNNRQLLADTTGSRRYGVVEITVDQIDIEMLKRERDGIFKGAMMALQQGALHYLTAPQERALTEANVDFEVGDSRAERLDTFLAANSMSEAYQRNTGFTLLDFMTSKQGLDIPLDRVRVEERGAVELVKAAGFRRGGRKMVNGLRTHKWVLHGKVRK